MSGERALAGLPTADDYNPDAIGTAKLEAGEPEQTWPKFGLELVPVEMDGTDTGRRIVRRNGGFLADVSSDYRLLPNEQAVKVANEVARDLGAKPFHEWSREGDRNDGWFAKLDDHVYQDRERRRVHALYAWDESHWEDEPIEYGFCVHNSIDKSLQFKVGLFSFRHACQNMVLMDVSEFPEQVEEEREVLVSESHRHTKGLEVDETSLYQTIKGSLLLIDSIDEQYRQWRDEVVTYDHIKGFIDRLPQDDVPAWMNAIGKDLNEAAENQDVDAWEELESVRRASIVEARMPETNMWDTYNDITEAIWHSDSTNDQTKQRKMQKVHRVAPLPGVR